jgi:hypothetical protein
VAPDVRGVPSLWIGDIGDNDSVRGEVTVYRVDEPRVRMTRSGPAGSPAVSGLAGSDHVAATAAPQVWRLRYPDGPADAESLAVAPGGATYIFTKSLLGATRVYAVPPRPDPARVQSLRRIGSIQFHLTGTRGGPNPIGEWAATSAALSRDSALLVVRTYTDAYVWAVPGGDVAAALRAEPAHLALPEQPQGEGITVDGPNLLIDSEHADSAVFAVPLPPVPRQAEATASGTAAATSGAATGSGAPTRSGAPTTWVAVLVVAAVALVAASLVFTARMFRLRRRRAGEPVSGR